nr:hypothetical protein [Tanacetum cinerariifolium]
TSRANQDNSPRIHKNAGHVARECKKSKRAKDVAYHREKMLLCKQEEAGIQLHAEQADWKDDTDNESDDQELEAHYMYMSKLQQVSPDVDDSRPIFDKEPEQKVQNDDQYDVFAIECQHTEQSESAHNTYLLEQDAQNVSIESVDMNYDSEQIEQNDEDEEAGIQLNAEQADWKDDTDDESDDQELEAHYMYMAKIQQVSPDVVDSGPIFDKEPEQKIDQYDEDADVAEEQATNKLSKENDLLFADFMKSKAKLRRRDSIEYATEMELEENVGSSMVQKSGIQCYNCKEYGHVARECQKLKRAKDVAYHREKMLLCKQEEAGIQLNAEQANWKDDTDDESDYQELEAQYMYMAKIQQVSPDAVNSGPIFDKEPEKKVQNDDHYDVFAIECQHPEQSKSVHKTYLIEQDAHNVLIESEDMNYDSEQIN